MNFVGSSEREEDVASDLVVEGVVIKVDVKVLGFSVNVVVVFSGVVVTSTVEVLVISSVVFEECLVVDFSTVVCILVDVVEVIFGNLSKSFHSVAIFRQHEQLNSCVIFVRLT